MAHSGEKFTFCFVLRLRSGDVFLHIRIFYAQVGDCNDHDDNEQ